MNFGSKLLEILKVQGMWGAVLATITFVLIGFFATKSGLFSKEINGKISKFVLTYAMPFLCIGAFMQPAKPEIAKELGIVIGLSVAFYLFVVLYSWIIIRTAPHLVSKSLSRKAEAAWEASDKTVELEKHKEAYINSYKQKLMTTQMMIGYGSLQFFAFPLVIAMSSGTGAIFAGSTLALTQAWCIPYMIGAFSYVKMGYSGQKFTKKELVPILKSLTSPMMLALYLSLVLWALQFVPGLNGTYKIVNGVPYTPSTEAGAAQFWAGFKTNLPAIGNVLTTGASIVSPLAWLVIGGSLAGSKLKEAAKDASVWVAVVRKLIVLPAVIFGLGFIFAVIKVDGTPLLSAQTLTMLVLLAGTPPAAVTMIFSAAYKHEHSGYTAQVSTLSTLLCLITIPMWIIIANASYVSVIGA